jgi:hypothetical protein
MAIAKGIVQGGNYTFSAANQTITFSSDYLGMSLSDITYITNIKSGVATVIYDPFDVAKGGVLNGLTLTLAYNTTLMSDSDPLQIIVGFTPSTATPQNYLEAFLRILICWLKLRIKLSVCLLIFVMRIQLKEM